MRGWIKSRKLSVNSLKRHLKSHFKLRHFSLIQNENAISEANFKNYKAPFEDFVRMGYSILLAQSCCGQIMQDKWAIEILFWKVLYYWLFSLYFCRKYDDSSMQLIVETNVVKPKSVNDLYVSCVVVLSPSFNVKIQYHHYFNANIVSDDDAGSGI